MTIDIYYAVSRRGQGRAFTVLPERDERLGIWVGENLGPISMIMLLFESNGFKLPKMSFEDNPVKLQLSLSYER